MGSDVPADMVVHGGWQGQVEESVGTVSPRQGRQMSIELRKRAAVVIRAFEVRVFTEEV